MKRILGPETTRRIFIGLLPVIFGGIVLQAPISVGLGSLWPHIDLLIKSWAEILMIVAGLLLIKLLYDKQQFKLLKDPLLVLIFGYGLLHIILLPFFYQGQLATIAGLFIDLRYVAFFVLVYLALKLYPEKRTVFVKVSIAGALVVVGFAILQVTVLPIDVLKYLGYNTHTIAPYLTVDLNKSFIRINSTLRGPNPVGAYAVIVLSLITAAIIRGRIGTRTKPQVIAAILAVGGLVAVWASYSRSAWLAAVAALAIIIVPIIHRVVSRKVWIAGLVVVGLVIGGLSVGLSGSGVFSNLFLHDNPTGGSATKSDQGHIVSLENAVHHALAQPFGAGIGSTGSASLLSTHPYGVENQYLFVAHETGWLGFIIFCNISIWVLIGLWTKRADYLALGVFASGIGLVIIGLLLPVWTDDTVSIIWWGLAAVALASRPAKKGQL
jgi:hypothetical protein